ncbi:heme-binding protein [Kocuria coralli]|uniref:Heme-binding protein n=1 Tax=Kocuria coralli TaxID=1461025 RepID=A0A5J5L1D1_9MICC|nr:heme-binding protein [Kocuria coralli]KAA9395709.1 heme-binding protein [Kocuria coralli]
MKRTRTLVPAAIAMALGAAVVLSGCGSQSGEGSAADDNTVSPVIQVAEQNIVSTSRLSAATAMIAAEAALAQCASDGLGAVSVAVVDRQGELQAFVRGDNAAQHTVDASRQKAYTAAAFGANTSDLVERADENGLHRLPGTLFMPGGVSVKAGDASIAGIGVGGAPSGMDDQSCAAAGLSAIEDRIEG